MDLKSFVIKRTLQSVDTLFNAVRKMPEDKVDWKPLDNGRSALSMAQECAQAPLWGVSFLTARKFEFDEERFAKAAQERATWSLDDCERICRENTAKLIEVIEAFPDSDLDQTITLPFGGGKDFSFAELMNLHYWNTTYHIGQVNYIQTLYGDKEMH